jgi:Mce-associated membrane protein
MPSPDLDLQPPVDGEPTKRCPYCAETIKAAAIKCRFCHSDLELDSGAGRAAEPEPGGRVAEPLGEAYRDPEPRSDPEKLPRWLLVPVAVAVLATLVLLGLAVKDWREADDLAAAADASQSVRAAVTDKVEALLSYQYDTFDQDRATAEKSMTSSFRAEYAPTVSEIRDRARQQKRSQEAQVAAVSVISATPDTVKTLVFVNTMSSTEGSKRQRLMQNRVEVTMVKQGDQWLIDKLAVPTS